MCRAYADSAYMTHMAALQTGQQVGASFSAADWLCLREPPTYLSDELALSVGSPATVVALQRLLQASAACSDCCE